MMAHAQAAWPLWLDTVTVSLRLIDSEVQPLKRNKFKFKLVARTEIPTPQHTVALKTRRF
jgi:hypothetical protein